MVAALSPIAALLFFIQAPPAETPRAVVLAAVRAVEGDSLAPVRQRWTQRLGRNPSDKPARLGLATLARLSYQYRSSDSLYRGLIQPEQREDSFSRYAVLGLAEGYATQGLPRRAAELYAQAESLAGSDRATRVQALLGLAGALARTQRDAAADSLVAVIDSLIPPDDPSLQSDYRCMRAGPPLLSGEREEAEEALAGARLARSAGDHRLEARCLLGVAKAHYRVRRQDSALVYSERAAQLALAARDRAGLAAIRQWRGYARLTGGDYGGAWHELHAALDLSQETGSLGSGGLAAMYLASLALRFGDPDLALGEAVLAESLLTRTGNQRTIGSLHAIRADIARVMGDTGLARRMYLDLVAQSGKFGGFGAVAPYRSLAAMARQRHDWVQAESLLATAQTQARQQGMQEWDQRLWYDRGAVALARGADRAAEAAFHRFLDGLAPNQQARGYAARIRLAELASRRNDFEGAESWLTAAADSLDALRARLDVPALRLQSFQIRDDEADPDLGFASVIASLTQHGKGEAAFALVERRRGRELADQLVRGLALRRISDDTARPGRMEPVTVAELQKGLSPSTALLSYLTGRGGELTTLFVARPDSLAIFQLPPIDTLAADLNRFTQAVERGAQPAALAERLGGILLGQAVSSLPPQVVTLIIIPDGGLYRLPFEALVVSGQPVLERFVTSELPSATLLIRLRSLTPRSGSGLLAFGDPARSSGDASALRAAVGPVEELEPLPEARGEARDVARFDRKGAALIGRHATETSFKRLASHQRVLHFAVHAVVSDQALTRTALLLAPTREDDGIVEPGEIAGQRLEADLVVLSACRSASGVTVAGEGVRGLIAPFLESGVRAVVGNTWAVSDHGARVIVGKLYRGLADGLSVGAALQRARLEARQEGLAPQLWAGFVLTGDPDVTVPLTQPSPSILWAILVAGAIAGGGWWIRRRFQSS